MYAKKLITEVNLQDIDSDGTLAVRDSIAVDIMNYVQVDNQDTSVEDDITVTKTSLGEFDNLDVTTIDEIDDDDLQMYLDEEEIKNLLDDI